MAQKVWNLYTNQGGSLNDGTIWFLQNGSTPGGTAGVPGPFDYVYFVNYGTTNENFTGTLGAQTIEVDAGPPLVLNGGAIGSSDLFIYTGSTLTLNGATATQTDGTNAINLYGGTLNLVGGTVNALGIYEGVMSGGSLIATSNSHLNFSGAPNGVPNAGLVGLTVKRSALIDNSTVTSPLGLIGIGDADPAANATMTVQNNSQVTALYTYIGSGNSTSGTLNILGSGTTYANVGPPSTLNSSGYTVVGGVSSVDPLTIPTGKTATLHVGTGAKLTDAGARVGEQAGTVGVATVDGGASWTTSTTLRVGQNGTGTLFVGAGSTVKSTGPHVLATSSISFGNNAGSLGVGTVSGAGAVLNTGGDRLTVGNSGTGGLTVSAGGTVFAGAVYTDAEAALSVGGSVGGSGGLVITGAGSSVVVTGQAVVAGNNIGAGAVAGGTGGISATLGGALYEQQGLTLFSGGRLSTDATGLIDIGGTAGRAGATTVEAGSTLTDLGGVVAGTLTGAGTVLVNGFDSVINSAGGLTYKFGAAQSTLALSAQSGGSALVNFSQGDAIEFVGQTLTPAFSGSVMTAGGAAFGLYGAPAGTHYLTTHDMAGDTFVTALSAANDFNGDGKSDDVLQNDNGTILIETTPGGPGTAVSGYLVGAPGGSWHVVGTGDFNGDGMPDILVQNTNGAVVDYIMNGTTPTASYLLAGAGTGYHVRGTGDFNGDGKTDIVVQNDDGSVAIWTTDGTKVTTATLVSNPGPGYTVEGVGDFNGDGQPDLLLQNTNSALVVYTMNGTNYQSGAVIGTPGVGWSVAGTGTDGTGKADILLHNDNGADVVYNTNGKTVTGATLVANPGPGYTGAVAGLDLNGDGTTDVLLQNTNSFIVDFGLNSAGAPVTATGITTPGVGWHAIGNTPIEFIDGTGSTFNLAATAGADQFDLTSFATGLHQISGFDPATDTVALSAATFGSYAALQNAMQIQPYAGGTFVGLGTGSALVIQGVTPSQISASDFVFR